MTGRYTDGAPERAPRALESCVLAETRKIAATSWSDVTTAEPMKPSASPAVAAWSKVTEAFAGTVRVSVTSPEPDRLYVIVTVAVDVPAFWTTMFDVNPK